MIFFVASSERLRSLSVAGRTCNETNQQAEVHVFADQPFVQALAQRIERAYALHRARGVPGNSAAGVWSAAAMLLLEATGADPELPLDPELFVAAQSGGRSLLDPSADLTQSAAIVRYRGCVRAMVARLRNELDQEVRRAERRIERGEDAKLVLLGSSSRLSPLGCFIAALRLRQGELAETLRVRAIAQHRSCPLYRQASAGLVSTDDYPVRRVARVRAESIRSNAPSARLAQR
jgi:hypothetical protein